MINTTRFIIILMAIFTLSIHADPPRSLPNATLPDDHRLKPLKNLNGYFPFTPPASPEVWEQRRQDIRRQILLGLGLYPLPEKTPLNPIIHSKVDRPEYTIEKVIFESYPGHFVTGSLYRPKNDQKKHPVVISVHGHFNNGRFHSHSDSGVKSEIAIGAERFTTGGKHPLQARAVQLARMGCIVLFIDMVGYADSIQLNHRPGMRNHMSKPDHFGFFSPQAELRLHSFMGLQTWNAIRATDLALSLPDADPTRVAVTGASGGGTQTMLLSAVDDRITVSVPAVMVSTAMQGGCTCENTPFLRIDSGNVEFAALFAPKPLWLTTADDWTIELKTKGYPQLQQLYKTLGKPKNFGASFHTRYKHNYNAFNRRDMYLWMNRHLNLKQSEPILENDYQPLSPAEHSVWDDKHPKPTGDQVGDKHELQLIKHMTQDYNTQFDKIFKSNDHNAYQNIIGKAWETIIGRKYNQAGTVKHNLSKKLNFNDILVMTGTLSVDNHNEELPVVSIYPKTWNKQVIIWLHKDGKNGLLMDDGRPTSHIAKLAAQGYTIVGVDLLHQGEFTNNGKSIQHATLVNQGQGSRKVSEACFTFGYNRSLIAKRAHDVISTIRFVNDDEHKPNSIHLVAGSQDVSPIAALALSQTPPDIVSNVALNTEGFRFNQLTELNHINFVPGAVKYLDLPGVISLNNAKKLLLTGEPEPNHTQIQTLSKLNPNAPTPIIKTSISDDDIVQWLIAH